MAEFETIMIEEKRLNIRELLQPARHWTNHVLKHWVIILLALVIGSTIGILVAINSPVKYTSRLSFILEEGKGGGGGLSSLAGQFGFDLGAATGGSSILSGENIVGLLRSRKFTRQVLLTPSERTQFSLADKYADVYGLRDEWKKTNKIDKDVFFPPGNGKGFSRQQDSLLQLMENRILEKELVVIRPDKRMSFFEVGLTSRDETLSKLFAERLVDDVVAFYIEAKTRRQRSNVERLQFRSDSIAALLNSKTYTAAAAQSQLLDVNPAHQTAAVNAEVSTRNKAMIGAIYAEIVKNLEIQKVTLNQETPVIQVVDEVQLPLKREQKSTALMLLAGGIIGVVISLLLISIKLFYTLKR